MISTDGGFTHLKLKSILSNCFEYVNCPQVFSRFLFPSPANYTHHDLVLLKVLLKKSVHLALRKHIWKIGSPMAITSWSYFVAFACAYSDS